jgi:hypothetical protein
MKVDFWWDLDSISTTALMWTKVDLVTLGFCFDGIGLFVPD